jgi:hypothetical protein
MIACSLPLRIGGTLKISELLYKQKSILRVSDCLKDANRGNNRTAIAASGGATEFPDEFA